MSPALDEEPEAATPRRWTLDWARKFELSTIIIAALLSPAIAVAGLWYSNNQIRDQLKISSEELRLSREGQITDRYTKAVESLGDDAMGVRLGSIYALQRIMEDSPRDQPTIGNVLATYIRIQSNKAREEKDESVTSDVYAALSVLARRDRRHDGSFTPDLRDAWLSHLQLRPTDLSVDPVSGEKVHGQRAGLSDVDLTGADLIHADLSFVDLSGATLSHANLSNAQLVRAQMENAQLDSAQLAGANLAGADLSEALLLTADFEGAILHHANLEGARFGGANLSAAILEDARLAGANLLSTRNLKVKQVVAAHITSTTVLPPRLANHPAVQQRIAESERLDRQHAD